MSKIIVTPSFVSLLIEIDEIIARLNKTSANLFEKGKHEKAMKLLEKVEKTKEIQSDIEILSDKWKSLALEEEYSWLESIEVQDAHKEDPTSDFPKHLIEIVEMLRQGKTNEEIANLLDLAVGTTRNYISSVYSYLDVKNRTEAVAIATSKGLLDPIERDQQSIDKIIRETKNSILRDYYNLTPREYDILKLLSKGYTNKKISKKLELGEGTVRNYLSSLIKKLDAKNRTEVVLIAKKYGLIKN